ncbi:uncharacterized protein LTR77_001059 [Saxophila tyrrhenica]|uniref:L-lactate dehydrogenase (cytochrome) n=1 Tax=Saxophila tyrrhenica TaxID=1690608 RepID=A0AAV9PJ71_9PEZI|nr:hypothetical protein LTR77_001059 [Saxophila tyrrhenica]
MLSTREIHKHNNSHSCWVVVDGQAYDVTEFLDHHPGGANSILRYAGRDATAEYEPVHPPGTIEKHLSKDKHLGPVEPETQGDSASTPIVQYDSDKPIPLSTVQNLTEFETEAKKVLSKKAWVYFHSAADSLNSLDTNRRDWTRVNLRPRILRNVARVSMRCRLMGHDSSLPFFICPAAQARLGHPDGELCLARGAGRYNIPYCSSTYSSVAHIELAKALAAQEKGGALLWQLYVPTAQEGAKQLISEARRLGFKALVLTVDTPVIGKREEDDRYKAELDHAAGLTVERTTSTTGEAPILRGVHSSTLCWDDLSWIQKEWGNTGPVVLKGIQTAEDALLAHEAGIDGIYLSNHGGRQMDFAPSSLQTLLEIRRYYPHLLKEMEVYLDGGVMRGTDVIKALCLGARGVGLGRPFMYALSAYGTEGVCKAIQLLSDEIETTMRLLGVTSLEQLSEFYINTAALENGIVKRIDVGASGSIVSKL